MITAVTAAEAATRLEHRDRMATQGNLYEIHHYMEGEPWEDKPEGFFADLIVPHGIIRPHFHPPDQFQVVMRGEGTFGRHEVAPVVVHYVDGHVPYGPIKAGPDGIGFFTLRARTVPGVAFMPEGRNELKGVERKPGSRNMAAAVPQVDTAALHAEEVVAPVQLFPCYEDGMTALVLFGGPGAELVGPDPAGSSGYHVVVVAGAAQLNGEEYPTRSLLFVTPDEEPLRLMAGPQGAGAVFLRYPVYPRPGVQ